MLDLIQGYIEKEIQESVDENSSGQRYGYLTNSDGSHTFPFIDNLFFYNIIGVEKDVDFFDSFFLKKNDYQKFLIQKSQRPYLDVYAAFQPFNEAFKALYPFLELAAKVLTPDAVILNLWDRNGWTTALLKSVFPTCRILTIWEGNKDVLGYQGYYHWFGNDPKIDVLFCKKDQQIPLRDHCIDLVIGMDAFHRYEQQLLLNELDRISKANGSFIFPHVHLTNSEPEPFFDRGCIQKHGRDYQSELDDLPQRKGYIFSEPDLFRLQQGEVSQLLIQSDPNTSDYNGLIAILSEKWRNHFTLARLSFSSGNEKLRLLLNPLYRIDLGLRIAYIDLENVEIKKLLDRHPIYLKQVDSKIKLSELQSKILLLAGEGYSIDAISVKVGIDQEKILQECSSLEHSGIVHLLPLDTKSLQFQTFIGQQKLITSRTSLKTFWEFNSTIYSEKTYLIDVFGNEFTYGETAEVVSQLAKKFQSIETLQSGDKIAILSSLNIESVILFWAATIQGITVVPLNQTISEMQLDNVLNELNIKMFFVSSEEFQRVKKVYDGSIIVFDSDVSEDTGNDNICFSEWMNEISHEELTVFEPAPDDAAVILHTSGSTGKPQGIVMTHSNLIKSGYHMSQHFGWKSEDVFIALGGLEYMSGLRNATTCALLSGTSVLIPSEHDLKNIFSFFELVDNYKPTIIAGNPAFFSLMIRAKKEEMNVNSLRLILCTGNNLSKSLRDDFYKKFNLPIHNYYGLTETCGICIAQDPTRSNVHSDDIGLPVGCLVRVAEADSNGEGLLQVWSSNLAGAQNSAKIDWFNTGDRAHVDKNGNICLTGRSKEIIKTKSEQIIPLSALEEVLQPIDEVIDVVAHISRKNGFEKLVLFLQLKAGTDLNELKERIKMEIKTSLTTEAMQIILFHLEDFPYENGKINKEKLLNETLKNQQSL